MRTELGEVALRLGWTPGNKSEAHSFLSCGDKRNHFSPQLVNGGLARGRWLVAKAATSACACSLCGGAVGRRRATV